MDRESKSGRPEDMKEMSEHYEYSLSSFYLLLNRLPVRCAESLFGRSLDLRKAALLGIIG